MNAGNGVSYKLHFYFGWGKADQPILGTFLRHDTPGFLNVIN